MTKELFMDGIKHVASVLLFCVLSVPARGGMITVGLEAFSEGPLVLEAGSSTEPLVFTLSNDTSADASEDFLSGWQLALVLVPEPGAAGSLAFGSVTDPDDYVFELISSFGVSVTNNGDSIVAFDFNFPFSGGVQVPTSPGVNVLSLTINTSTDALGAFGLYFDSSRTEWTDSATPTQAERPFANVPRDGGLTLIGRILVPEPASGLLLLFAASGLLAHRRRV